jgi:hypothetical protein
MKINPYTKKNAYVKKSATLVYSGKIGFSRINVKIMGKANNKTNWGR